MDPTSLSIFYSTAFLDLALDLSDTPVPVILLACDWLSTSAEFLSIPLLLTMLARI